MYRLNRIGPSPMITLESAPVAMSGIDIGNAQQPLPTVGYRAEATIPWTGVGSVQMTTPDAFSITNDNGVAIGTKISGGDLFTDQTSDPGTYLLGCACSYFFETSDESVESNPIVGRVDTNGQASGTLPQFALVPQIAHQAPGSANDTADGATSVQVVIGDWRNEGVILTNDIFFGVFLANLAVSPANITRFTAFVSIHRYETDLNAYDPNR